jgi:hypothetical protein
MENSRGRIGQWELKRGPEEKTASGIVRETRETTKTPSRLLRLFSEGSPVGGGRKKRRGFATPPFRKLPWTEAQSSRMRALRNL